MSVTDTVIGETLSSEDTLFGGEPLGGGRVVRKNQPGEETGKG